MLYIYININYKAAIDTEATLDSTSTFFLTLCFWFCVLQRWINVLQQASIICEVRMIRKSSSILTVSRRILLFIREHVHKRFLKVVAMILLYIVLASSSTYSWCLSFHPKKNSIMRIQEALNVSSNLILLQQKSIMTRITMDNLQLCIGH